MNHWQAKESWIRVCWNSGFNSKIEQWGSEPQFKNQLSLVFSSFFSAQKRFRWLVRSAFGFSTAKSVSCGPLL